MVIDTEDGCNDSELHIAIQNIQNLLNNFKQTELIVFIRVRDISLLKQLLDFNNISKIDGFLLPKFSLFNAYDYLTLLKPYSFYIMPSIEGSELFDSSKLISLREILLDVKDDILTIRIGFEDMLKQVGLKRECDVSLFDISVTSYVLGSFIAIFKSEGFNVSGGVYPCFKDIDGFKNDLLRDIKEGLFSKTIIHPNQIEIVDMLYKVTNEQLSEALEITNAKEVVFNQNSKMAEINTMTKYAQNIIKRYKIYGIN